MAEETGDTGNAAQEELQMREHEREARERASEEGTPEERRGEGPGAPVFPSQKSPGS